LIPSQVEMRRGLAYTYRSMIALGIETSEPIGSVALLSDGSLAEERTLDRPLSHAESLLPAMHDLLEDSGIAKEKIDRIVVNRGPGSFTGLRIGLAAAKGLAQALDIPLIGVDGMSVFRLRYASHRRLCVILPSRRDLRFAQWFSGDRANGEIELLRESQLAERLATEKRMLSVTGSGAQGILDRMSDHPWIQHASENGTEASALWVARAGLERQSIDQLYEVEPLYVEPVLA